ncbi:hypothetical protein BDZ91DRAFT_114468 [Kalaharituber pfeilii]|nr:hypothetical protein BDZ91DRAFT_114468 [Kalaharituber pfeilii]
MKSFTAISAFFAALVATAAATTTPVGDPIGNPILRPGLHEQVPVDKEYEIKWDVTLHPESTVTLLLLKGPSTNVVPVGTIVEKTANDGSYSFTPSTTFPNLVLHDSTEGWGIQLIVDSTGQYQYSTQFGFLNPGVSEGDRKTTTTASAVETTSVIASDSTVTTNSTVPATTTTEPTTTTTTTTTIPVNATTTKVTKTATTTKITTTSAGEEETTSATTLITSRVSVTPSGNATTSTRPPIQSQSDSGVGRVAVSLGMGAVAVLVAGFSVL